MPQRMTDTERVFRDLERSLRKIRENWESPVEVRTSYEAFLTASKKFRIILPKDFKRLTGRRWEYDDRPTILGSLFSLLRDADFHERPARLKVRERVFYHQGELPPGTVGCPPSLVLSGTFDISDPHAELHPDRLKLSIPQGDDEGTEVLLEPDRRDFLYLIDGTSKRTKKLLKDTGTNDLIRLCSAFLAEARTTFELFKVKVEPAKERTSRFEDPQPTDAGSKGESRG